MAHGRTVVKQRSEPFVLTNRIVSPMLLTLLKGKACAVLGRSLAVVGYHGCWTGEPHELVAQYRLDGSTVRIPIGVAGHQRWWRNFTTPHPMTLRLAGRDYLVLAHVERNAGAVTVTADLRDPSEAHPREDRPRPMTLARAGIASRPPAPRASAPLWRDRRGPTAVGAVALAAVLGGATAVWSPRGPVTTAQALLVMVASLLAGAGAGWLLRSRWAMLLAPVSYALALELVRVRTDGPLVDRIVLTSPYGIIALALGRGVHGLLAGAPMVLGAAVGAGFSRRRSGALRPPGSWSRVRRLGAVLLSMALLVLTVGIARPPSTAAIVLADGSTRPGSIAELTRIRVGNHSLGLMLRGNRVDSPVLLFLAGGPGGSELGGMRRHGQTLEQDFVVATFDQRGAGSSYDQLEPVSSLTLEHAVDDVVAVTRHLHARFGQERIIIAGQSWGTIPAVLAAQRHPELFRAYVGVGQMVDPLETDTRFYADTLAWARRTDDDSLTDALVSSGPPPYEDVLDYEAALSHEPDVYPYDRSSNDEGVAGFSENLLVREYSLLQQAHALAAFMDVFTVLYPQLQDLDLRREVPSLRVPVFLATGRHEAPGRAGPAAQWFTALDAPLKQRTVFETSGHRPMFEQPAQFHRFMVDVLDRT